MDPRVRRLAENEALFREINERSRASAADVWAHQQAYHFVCECADADCSVRLALTESDYEHVRSQARWFLVAPGHASPEIEQMVMSRAHFEIVEMRGDAARLAEQWDSRGRHNG
jgi:hypothetical protein